MKYRLTPLAWVALVLIIALSAVLGTVYGRTSYIPEICNNLKKEHPEPITEQHPEYSKYLDSNNNKIACD